MTQSSINPTPDQPRRLADLIQAQELPRAQALGALTLAKVAVLVTLLVGLNWWQFGLLLPKWYEPNWSHSSLIPLFSLFLVFQRRSEFLLAPRRVCLWGLPIVILGIVLSLARMLGGVLPGAIYVSHVSILIVAIGLVLYLAGPRMAKLAWLPIFFLLFAIPIPDNFYTRLASPLQDFAAKASAAIMSLLGVGISAIGSSLRVETVAGSSAPYHDLEVVEACSGVRSLMMYMALGVAWAYLESRPAWQKIVLVLSAIPIAMVTNVARICITCEMNHIDKPRLGEGFMHEATGIIMLIPAALLFWLLSWILGKMMVETDEDEPSDDSPANVQATIQEAKP
jgi:exosortase